VDIILLDETHSASVIHHNDVDSDREISIPTFAISPRTPSIDFRSHHHKHSIKGRSRTSQFSLLPNSTESLTHTGFTSFSLPSPSCSLSLHNHRSYHSPSASTMSTSTASTSIAPSIIPDDTPITCARCHRQGHPVRYADPRYSLPRPKQAQGYRRHLHTSPAES
jgi:hypothetical protein